MAKYVIDIDFTDQDCSFCPYFEQEDRRRGWCRLTKDEGKMWGELRTIKGNKVLCFDRPEWCPLTTVDEYETEEYLKVVNSQLIKDEELVELRMELYESEYDALQLMAWKSRLTMAQQVAKLIEEADRE